MNTECGSFLSIVQNHFSVAQGINVYYKCHQHINKLDAKDLLLLLCNKVHSDNSLCCSSGEGSSVAIHASPVC
jgi:hypothetical protein